MTLTDPAERVAQDALDAICPRRSAQYLPTLAYLTAYLQTRPAERRLAMRALKAVPSAPVPEAEPVAEDSPEGLPPEAPGRSEDHGKMLERQSRPDNPVSPSLPECGGKLCEVRDGKTVHKQDPSCAKFNGKRAVRA